MAYFNHRDKGFGIQSASQRIVAQYLGCVLLARLVGSLEHNVAQQQRCTTHTQTVEHQYIKEGVSRVFSSDMVILIPPRPKVLCRAIVRMDAWISGGLAAFCHLDACSRPLLDLGPQQMHDKECGWIKRSF